MKNRYRTSLNRMALLALPLASSLVLIGACASAPVAPTASMSQASQAIERAEQSDGRQYAGGELDQAKQKMSMAQRAVERQEMVEAEQFAEQAKITAELVMAKTESAKAKEVNREMERSTKALTEEMRRAGDNR